MGADVPPQSINPGQGSAPSLPAMPGVQTGSWNAGTSGLALAPSQGVNSNWAQIQQALKAQPKPTVATPVTPIAKPEAQPNPSFQATERPQTQIKAPAAQSAKEGSKTKFNTFMQILGASGNVVGALGNTAGAVAALKNALTSQKTASSGILKGGGVGGLSAASGVNLQPASTPIAYNPNNRAQIQYESSPLKMGGSSNDLVSLLKSLKGSG